MKKEDESISLLFKIAVIIMLVSFSTMLGCLIMEIWDIGEYAVKIGFTAFIFLIIGWIIAYVESYE